MWTYEAALCLESYNLLCISGIQKARRGVTKIGAGQSGKGQNISILYADRGFGSFLHLPPDGASRPEQLGCWL